MIIDVLPHVYENFLKNIVATSTLRYAKYLLKGAKDLYEEDKKKVKDNSEKTMPISAPNLLKEKEPVASKPSETKDEKLKEPLVKATKEVNDEKKHQKKTIVLLKMYQIHQRKTQLKFKQRRIMI